MFAEKNPVAWSQLLNFLVERVVDDIMAERAAEEAAAALEGVDVPQKEN